jgi:hypothetical protein
MAVVVLLYAATQGTGSLRAEICNCFTPLSVFDVDIYNITIAGNVINNLNLNATKTDPNLNPFVKIGGSSTVKAALDGNGNTVVSDFECRSCQG